MITKKDVAAQLHEAARLLDVLDEDPQRAKSLIMAARSFENYQGDVAQLHSEGRLGELRGVGSRTLSELEALFAEGMMPLLASLRERVPVSVREMFAVSGLGAKRIGQLWRTGIEGLSDLQEACTSGRIVEMPGFGPKSAANLAESVAFAIGARSAMRLDEAERLAEAIRSALNSQFPDARIEPAGEFRRGLETVSQLEFVIAGAELAELHTVAAKLFDDLAPDEPLSGILMGHRVSLIKTEEDSFGTTILRATGNDGFMAYLRERARDRGVDFHSLNAATEQEVFEYLGVPFVPPELRESSAPSVPQGLIQVGDIKGLVHNHTTWSDGALPLRGMIAAAIDAGYSYLAIADHSVSSAVANGLSAERLTAQAVEVEEVRAELREVGSEFELLHGLEVDILADGSLDLPDEALARLDYVVASVHQNFSLSEEAQTERIVRAVEHPSVDILAHPTGRLLLKRPGYKVDLARVIEACARSGTVIEINANTRRLELDWRELPGAAKLGCLFSINPDAHSPTGYDDVRYGVTVARKGGLIRDQVVNTAATGQEFLARLPKRRSQRR